MQPPPSQPLCRQIARTTVATVVQRFYAAVLADGQLAPYFSHIDDWPAHQRHIVDFWWSLMGGQVEQPRPNAMAAGHRAVPFGPQELERWLALFDTTLRQTLPAEAAERWGKMARGLGQRMREQGLVQAPSASQNT